jgi:hypothetical protein
MFAMSQTDRMKTACPNRSWGAFVRVGMALCLTCAAAGETRLARAEPFAVVADSTDSRTVRVDARMNVKGSILTPKAGGTKETRALEVTARFVFDERSLPGTGRGPKALRCVRWFETARSEIQSGEQLSFGTLRPAVQLIVAQGEPYGVDAFSPAAPLGPQERMLLQLPGDPLVAQALLPERGVEVRETWKPSEWVIQTLANVEATQKSSLACTLESLVEGVATVTFSGEIEGLTQGATAKVGLTGRLKYVVASKLVSEFTMTQKETRDIGPVSPGLDVEATVAWTKAVSTSTRFTDERLATLPVEANEANQLLQLELSQWGLKLYHDRNWSLFHQTPRMAILRMLDQGSLVAQLNIERLSKPADGKPIPLPQFEAEVKRALDKNFKEIRQSSEFKTTAGLTAYRVAAGGEAQGVAMEWHYYLVFSPEGEQVALVFVVEPVHLETLGSTDLKIVETLELSPVKGPQPAAAGPTKSNPR